MNDKVTNMNRYRDIVILSTSFVLLTSLVFQGYLRFILFQTGRPLLVYVPKFLLAATFLFLILSASLTGKIRWTTIAGASMISVPTLVGVLYTGSVIQVVFELFVFLPLFFGVVAEPTLHRYFERCTPYVAILLASCIIGVAYNYFIGDVPWSGIEYKIGTTALATSRHWNAFGINRVSGFSIASYAAAAQLIIFTLCLALTKKRNILHRITIMLVWILSIAAILVTTTKTAVAVIIALALFFVLLNARIVPKLIKRVIVTSTPIIIAFIGIIAPLSTVFIDYGFHLNSFISRFVFASLGDRLDTTWPNAIELLAKHGNWVLGRGIGGIGVAQQYFEAGLYEAGDNIYLYLYVMLGVASVFLVALYVFAVSRLNVLHDRWDRLMWFLSITVLWMGWTTNELEEGLAAFVLGVTFSYAVRRMMVNGSRRGHCEGAYLVERS